MDYRRIYAEFITDRWTREGFPGKKEHHHIVPRCLGGLDCPKNLIRLSLQDHLFAHLLLARIHGGLLASAFVRMLGQKKYAGRRSRQRFAKLREEAGRLASHRNRDWRPTPEQRARHKASYTPERRSEIGAQSSARIAAAQAAGTYKPPALGHRHSANSLAKISRAASTNAARQWSDPEKRAAVKASNQRTWSDPAKLAEHSELMSEKLNQPHVRQALTAANKISWQDPEVRARRLAGMAAARQRKKENA